MIDGNVFNYVNKVLDDLEDEFGINILYAVESGSRAWGFDNKYSDYDIRFIYKKPLEDYLTIHPVRDVIDYNNLKDRKYDYPLDFSGWDVRKSLQLYYKNNPNLREWIESPIVYRGDSEDIFKGLPGFSKVVLCNHYSSMAVTTFNRYLKSTVFDELYIKKQLYVIRCILSWVLIKECDVYPPINIYDLLKHSGIKKNIWGAVLDNIYSLLKYYRGGGCNGDGSVNDCIIYLNNQFIEPYISALTVAVPKNINNNSNGDDNPYLIYDDCFRSLIL